VGKAPSRDPSVMAGAGIDTWCPRSRKSLAMKPAPCIISEARGAADVEAARSLFRAYAERLGVDLCFQGFAEELAGLPGKYASPDGALLLARSPEGRALGCVALRPCDQAGVCEMKRLYVMPEARRLGVGATLLDAVLAVARTIGYCEIRLDTLPQMAEARALYGKAGFKPIPPYYDSPIAGTAFLAKTLVG
jgi:ribosomal protein S18 acetylase RimI-like enzyme